MCVTMSIRYFCWTANFAFACVTRSSRLVEKTLEWPAAPLIKIHQIKILITNSLKRCRAIFIKVQSTRWREQNPKEEVFVLKQVTVYSCQKLHKHSLTDHTQAGTQNCLLASRHVIIYLTKSHKWRSLHVSFLSG